MTVRIVKGERFGHWLVLEEANPLWSNNPRRKIPRYLCICDCSARKLVTLWNLRSGASTSCGCYRNVESAIRMRRMRRANPWKYLSDFQREHGVGTIFGLWEVRGVPRVGDKKISCTCLCGTRRKVAIRDLLTGKSKSCGCARRKHRSGKPPNS